jgi:hypothetical protein
MADVTVDTVEVAWAEYVVAEEAAQAAIREAQRAKGAVRDAIAPLWGLKPSKVSIGGWWECATSPIGICVYNDEEDRGHDSCLYCEEPAERK